MPGPVCVPIQRIRRVNADAAGHAHERAGLTIFANAESTLRPNCWHNRSSFARLPFLFTFFKFSRGASPFSWSFGLHDHCPLLYGHQSQFDPCSQKKPRQISSLVIVYLLENVPRETDHVLNVNVGRCQLSAPLSHPP